MLRSQTGPHFSGSQSTYELRWMTICSEKWPIYGSVTTPLIPCHSSINFELLVYSPIFFEGQFYSVLKAVRFQFRDCESHAIPALKSWHRRVFDHQLWGPSINRGVAKFWMGGCVDLLWSPDKGGGWWPEVQKNHRARLKGDPRLRECCRQAEAEVISNSSNNIHQTWSINLPGAHFS